MFQPKITKEEVNALPLAAFGGQIAVVDRPEQVADAVAELSRHAEVGVDTETKPSFVRGKVNQVSLLQIATDDRCYLFRLNKIGFPPALEAFLADKRVKKIGLAMRDDMAGLNKHHRFRPTNVDDLQNLVMHYGILELGLQKMFAIVFRQKISKSQQLSNWENDTLTPAQQSYAATDAWACLRIYRRLMTEPRLTPVQVQALLGQYENVAASQPAAGSVRTE